MNKIDTRSPLSMSGFTSRYWRLTQVSSRSITGLLIVPRVVILVALWLPLLVWNFVVWVVFFWFTIAWRAYRRGHRRDKRDAAFQSAMLNK